MRRARGRVTGRTSVRAALGALLAGACVVLTGCNSLGSTDGAQGFIDQQGVVKMVPVADRGAPISLSGSSLTGQSISLDSYRGKPMVVNVWGSWCDPCIAEAPALARAAQSMPGVPFLGIDIRESSQDNAESYERSFGITYPSIYDPSSSTLLSFSDYPVQSPPTTFVLDAQGRVAAYVIGELPSTTTLVDLVHDVATST